MCCLWVAVGQRPVGHAALPPDVSYRVVCFDRQVSGKAIDCAWARRRPTPVGRLNEVPAAKPTLATE